MPVLVTKFLGYEKFCRYFCPPVISLFLLSIFVVVIPTFSLGSLPGN